MMEQDSEEVRKLEKRFEAKQRRPQVNAFAKLMEAQTKNDEDDEQSDDDRPATKATDFFEDEAELSGSDEVSEDEDEDEGEDEYEEDEQGEELPSEDEQAALNARKFQ